MLILVTLGPVSAHPSVLFTMTLPFCKFCFVEQQKLNDKRQVAQIINSIEWIHKNKPTRLSNGTIGGFFFLSVVVVAVSSLPPFDIYSNNVWDDGGTLVGCCCCSLSTFLLSRATSSKPPFSTTLTPGHCDQYTEQITNVQLSSPKHRDLHSSLIIFQWILCYLLL